MDKRKQPHSAEHKRKISESHKGLKLSETTKKKLSDAFRGSKSHFWKDGRSQDKEWIKKLLRDAKNKRRLNVVEKLGGKCACCGENEYKFLAIDHISGGGTKETRERGGGDTFQFVVKDNFPLNKYQILCHNYNFAKHFWKQCPHQALGRLA